MFFERLRCSTRRADDHRQEHTGSDPGSQCLRSWLDQDSRGCRSERLDRFRIRPKESSFRPQLAFFATGDGPRRHAPAPGPPPEAIATRLKSWSLVARVRSRTGDAIRSRSSSPLGRKSQPPPAQAGEALGCRYQSPLCRESLPWRLGFRPVQATLERNHALTSTDLTLQRASPRTPAPHRRGEAFVRFRGRVGRITGLSGFRES